jgi:phosphotransferase system HPr (HPr) family protein
MVVRLASRHSAEIELRRGNVRANARRIIDVLALGAAKGEEMEVEAQGEDAEAAVRAMVELVARGFSADLLPETGSAAVEGVAIGRAVVVLYEEAIPGASRGVREETARAHGAMARAEAELTRLVEASSTTEAALFEPELAILRDAAPRIEADIARGSSAETAVRAVLGGTATDLIADARARLLDVLAGSDGASVAKVGAAGHGDLVLVTDRLTPSLVASLPPRVRGIVAVAPEPADPVESGLPTSHAAILARARGVPLALVPSHSAAAIADGDELMVDTTTPLARVWVGPSRDLVRDGHARQEAIERAREDDDRAVAELASRLGIELCVNVGALQERVPRGAHGVGLLRTELLFAARSGAPREDEQYAALVAVARAAHGQRVTARLFDAGGDKPLAWLPARGGDERGMALLFANPEVLETQLRAVSRAAASHTVRVLLPMCRSAADVRSVRALASSLEVGAMIETPEAAHDAATIAGAADFVCVGTNDLAALVLRVGRAEAERALRPPVLALVAEIVRAAHAHRRRVTICGELAADPTGARVLVGLDVDALSVAPARFASVARALHATTREECRAAAEAALRERP